MSKKPNFKVEAHKAITRILSLDSRVQRERILAEFLKDIHDRGEVAAVKRFTPPAKNITAKIKTNPIDDFVAGLLNLGETMDSLSRDLAEVR